MYNKPSLSYLEFISEDLITASNVQDSIIINNSQIDKEPLPEEGGGDAGLN